MIECVHSWTSTACPFTLYFRTSCLLYPSFYATGMMIVGIVLAGLDGKTNLNDAGIVQVLYIALLPAAMFSTLMIAKFWVESLPSQVRHPQ